MITHYLKDNIIHIIFEGDTIYAELTELGKTFTEHTIEGDVLLLIYDLRYTKLILSVNEYRTASDFAQEMTANYNHVRAAFVSTSPIMTAMLTIFSQLTWSNKTQRKVFSTIDAAIAWLQLFNNY